MINLYSVIIVLFCLAGAALALYSWNIISKKRPTALWPSIEGLVTNSCTPSQDTDYLPRVIYSFEVNGKQFQNNVELPPGESSMPEFAAQFLKQYPLGKILTVYYDPKNPQNSRLSVGATREDWLIFYLGIGAILLGIALILVNI